MSGEMGDLSPYELGRALGILEQGQKDLLRSFETLTSEINGLGHRLESQIHRVHERVDKVTVRVDTIETDLATVRTQSTTNESSLKTYAGYAWNLIVAVLLLWLTTGTAEGAEPVCGELVNHSPIVEFRGSVADERRGKIGIYYDYDLNRITVMNKGCIHTVVDNVGGLEVWRVNAVRFALDAE